MIIKVEQTKANTAAEFQVSVNNQLLYKGKAPRTSAFFSCQLENVRSSTVLYKTKIQPITEFVNRLPFRWILPNQVIEVSTILDANDNKLGSVFQLKEQFYKSSYYNILLGDLHLKIYSKSTGTYENLLIFIGDQQIGQVVKKLKVHYNLDNYTVYLLDEFEELCDIISLFVIYFDNWNYGHQLEFVKGTETTIEYSFSTYDKLYDPDWIQTHFKQKTNEIPYESKTEINAELKKTFTIMGLIFGGIVLVGGCIFAIALNAG